eukprot:g9010.t1
MVRTNVRRDVKGVELKPFEAIGEEFKKAYSVWTKTKKQRAKLESQPDSQIVRNLYANEHLALWVLADSLSSLVVNHGMKLDKFVGENADKYMEMLNWLANEMDDIVAQPVWLSQEDGLYKEQILRNLTKYLDLNRGDKVQEAQKAAFDAVAAGEKATDVSQLPVEKMDMATEQEVAIAVPQDTIVANAEVARKTVVAADAASVGTQRLSATMPTHDGLGAAWDENVKPLLNHEDKATERVVFQDMLVLTHPNGKTLSVEHQEVQRLNLQETLGARAVRVLTRGGATLIEIADAVDRVTPLQMRDGMVASSWPYEETPVTQVRDANCQRFYVDLPRNLNDQELEAVKEKLKAATNCMDIKAGMAMDADGKPSKLAFTAVEPAGKLDMAAIEAALKGACPSDAQPAGAISRGRAVERYLANLNDCPDRHSQTLLLMRNKLKEQLGCKDARVVPRSGRLNVDVISPMRGPPTAKAVQDVLSEPLAPAEADALKKAVEAGAGNTGATLKMSTADGWQVCDVTYGAGASEAQRAAGVMDVLDAAMKGIGKQMGDAYSTFSTPEDAPSRKSRKSNFNFAPSGRMTNIGGGANAGAADAGAQQPPAPRETRGDGPQNFDKLIADEHNLQGRISIALPVYGFAPSPLGPNALIDGNNLLAKDEATPDGITAIGSQYAFDNGGYYAEAKVIKTAGAGTGFVGLGFSTVPVETYGEALGSRLADLGKNWVCTGPYPKEETHNLLCNGKTNLRFVYAHAKTKEEQTMNWQVGDTLGVWIRRRDGKAKEWLLSVFINKNRIYTCNCNIPDGIEHFRIVTECGGRVKGIKLLTDAHPPARLALNYWYNPLKKGAQRIIENILFVDESCAKKHPLKVDWTMSMSPCNISHTETKKCKILQWSNQTLANPLTRLPELDKSLALKCSKMILVLMANRVLEQGKEPTSDERAKIAYTLFWYFKHRQCLRDEILLFVIKQLTQNPERKSTLFGYVLLQILMEGAIEANYHLPILMDDFLNNQESGDAKIMGEITKTRKLFREIHDKFAQAYVHDEAVEV